MSNISKQIMDQIKDKGLKPRPRWQFVLIGILLVICLISTIISGGLVTSLIFLKLFNTQWDFVSLTGERGLPAILEVLPLVWIALLILVLLISIWAFERTEQGYKYKPTLVVLVAIVLSTALGGVIYITQGADLVDDLLQASWPSYQLMEERFEAKFHLPDKGILPGHVVVVESATVMQLEDYNNHLWRVRLNQNKVLPPNHSFVGLQEGMTVFVIGQKQDEDSFLAVSVRKNKRLPPSQVLRDRLRKRFLNNQPKL